jgi:predicted O-methyltransferase YrrM
MVAAGESGQYDFCFIDADKTNYDTYYEYALVLLRPGGLIGIDNVLWSGAVIDPKDQTPDTKALRALNEKIATDARVTACLIPIGDGLTLARKR